MSELEEIEKRVRWFARTFGGEGLIRFLVILLKNYCEHSFRELFKEMYYEVKSENDRINNNNL